MEAFMMQYKEAYLDTNNGKLWYCIYEQNNIRTPVIVIHGGPGATHNYLLPIKELSKNRQIIFYDQNSSGNSQASITPQQLSIELFVDELNALIRHLHLKQVILLGQSWGSALALELYDKYLNIDIEKIIFSAPYFSTKIWENDAKTLINNLPNNFKNIIKISELNQDYNNQNYNNAIKFYYAKHLYRLETYPEELLTTFKKMNNQLYQKMWGPSEFTVTGTLKDYDITAKLQHLNIPTLFTCGEFDEVIPDTLKFFASKVINSKVAIFKDASHEHHLEQKENYIKIVSDFINN